MPPKTLNEEAIRVLQTANAVEKAQTAQAVCAAWRAGELTNDGSIWREPPDRPARPDAPELISATRMPRRNPSGEKGRFALLHSLAHIELNAVDLAFDMVARFGCRQDGVAHPPPPPGFVDDWMRVGDEEAKHFLAVEDRLIALGGHYGDLPAHDGLWEAALETRHHMMARLAIVPLVLEARGLDVTPRMIRRLQGAGDKESVATLEMIYSDEKGHVRVGMQWFHWLADLNGETPHEVFHRLVQQYFRGKLKPPFNHEARAEAGLTEIFYLPLSAV